MPINEYDKSGLAEKRMDLANIDKQIEALLNEKAKLEKEIQSLEQMSKVNDKTIPKKSSQKPRVNNKDSLIKKAINSNISTQNKTPRRESYTTGGVIMARARCDEILSSFKSDSTGKLDSAEVRRDELSDSPTSKYPWFITAYEMTTLSGRYRNRMYKIYRNSFGEQRNLFDEEERINLFGGSEDRKAP